MPSHRMDKSIPPITTTGNAIRVSGAQPSNAFTTDSQHPKSRQSTPRSRTEQKLGTPLKTGQYVPPPPTTAAGSLSHIKIACHFAYLEASRNKAQFIQGASSIWVVVVVVSILVTTIYYTPIISLSLAELNSGELDLVFEPVSGQFNMSSIDEWVTTEKVTGRVDKRTIKLYRPSSCLGIDLDRLNDTGFPYTGRPGVADMDQSLCSSSLSCFEQLCSRTISGALYLFDWRREREFGIGRVWSGVPSVARGSALLQSDLAEYLDAKEGDIIFGELGWFNIPDVYRETLSRASLDGSSGATAALSKPISFPLRVISVFDTPGGKLDSELKSLVFMDIYQVIPYLADNLHPALRTEWRESLLRSKLQDYVDSVIVACTPLPRTNFYLDDDFARIARRFLAFASSILTRFGVFYANTKTPVLSSLDATKNLSSFLGMLLSLVILVLGALSTFLIYSLLMVSVETKIFELGILRMIGMTRPLVVKLLIVQALSYAIPALILGLASAQGIFVLVSIQLSRSLLVELPWSLVPNAYIWSCGLAIVVPLVSSIFPIKKALRYNIRDALSRRTGFQALKVKLTRVSSIRPPLPLLLYGTVLTGSGFVMYYYVPKALVERDLALLFSIFLSLLIAMLAGMALLALNLQTLVQTILSHVIILPKIEFSALRVLTLKNLAMHRERNKKTAFLYTVALACLIFLNVTTTVELESLEYRIRKSLAADIRIQSNRFFADGRPLGIGSVADLEDLLDSSEAVESFAWYTQILDRSSNQISSTTLSNLGRLASLPQNIYGVTPGLFDMAPSSFISPTTIVLSQDRYGQNLGKTESIYGIPSGQAIMGTRYQEELNLSPESPNFVVQVSRGAITKAEQARASAFLKSAPVFTMSEYPNPSTQDMLLSIPDYLRLSGGYVASAEDMPLRGLMLKLSDKGHEKAQRLRLKASISNLLGTESLVDLEERLLGVRTAKNALEYVFVAITVLVMVLTFFSLTTSMYINVLEQKRDIAILRALGLSRFALFRLYMYEALLLVLTCALLGTAIGTIMGWTITSQRTVLTGLPIPVKFPFDVVVVVVVLTLVSAVASTAWPVFVLIYRKRIVELLKH